MNYKHIYTLNEKTGSVCRNPINQSLYIYNTIPAEFLHMKAIKYFQQITYTLGVTSKCRWLQLRLFAAVCKRWQYYFFNLG